MKELVGSVVLLDRVASAFDRAEVFRDLDQKNFDDFERLWRPMLKSRRDEFSSWGESAAANAQDSHWEWVEKAKDATHSLQYETFAVECSGETQGLMLVDITKFGRLDGQQGVSLCTSSCSPPRPGTGLALFRRHDTRASAGYCSGLRSA